VNLLVWSRFRQWRTIGFRRLPSPAPSDSLGLNKSGRLQYDDIRAVAPRRGEGLRKGGPRTTYCHGTRARRAICHRPRRAWMWAKAAFVSFCTTSGAIVRQSTMAGRRRTPRRTLW
jgi:hypothetical protein